MSSATDPLLARPPPPPYHLYDRTLYQANSGVATERGKSRSKSSPWTWAIVAIILSFIVLGVIAAATQMSSSAARRLERDRQEWDMQRANWNTERRRWQEERADWNKEEENWKSKLNNLRETFESEQHQQELVRAQWRQEQDTWMNRLDRLREAFAEEKHVEERAREQWRLEEERRRQQEGPEARSRWLSALWEQPRAARCLAYNVREYTAQIRESEVCKDAPLALEGTIAMAHSCRVVSHSKFAR